MVSRRHFIATLASLPLLSMSTSPLHSAPVKGDLQSLRIGLALGGGGAKGLAHIPVFELLDELGIRPHRIAGTSIGAIMGMLYAAGLSGVEIRELFNRLLIQEDEGWREILQKRDLLRWLDFIDLDFGEGGLIASDDFLAFLHSATGVRSFAELKIPLQVVAAELWSGQPVVLDSGDVLQAVQASMAVPGLFAPVAHEERYLVDGGVANPVPYDLLLADCDLVIAVDVLGQREGQADQSPSIFSTIFASFTNMQRSILAAKLEQNTPHLLIQPELVGVRVLEFYKAEEIYRQAAPSIESARRQLEKRLKFPGV